MGWLMNTLRIFDQYLTTLERGFVGIGIMMTTLLVFLAVITRYFFDYSPSWIEELTTYITLWIVFVGAALCIKKTEHVSVDIIFHLIPKRAGQILMGIISILSAIFIGYFGYASYALVASVHTTYQVSTAMDWLPMYVVYLSAIVGSLLMILEFFKLGWRFLFGKQASLQ
jgi:C4-dicarboxylate transporter DctQ subunit